MSKNQAQNQLHNQNGMPKAVQPKDTSVSGARIGGFSINNGRNMDSIHEQTELPRDVQMKSSIMSNSEFGLPLTEDADNLPTMAQLSLNFTGTGDRGGIDNSMRSGVFGGYNQSGVSSSSPSFRNDLYSSDQDKLNKITKQGHHSRKGTFGGQTTEDLIKNGGNSPVTMTKINRVDNPSIVVSEDGEELQGQDPNETNQPGQLDQDFEFIEEVLAGYLMDINQKKSVLVHVQQAIEKGKRKIPEEMQDMTLSEVQNLEENFKKVIGFANFLMENVRRFSYEIGNWQQTNMQLEHNQAEMSEQVMYMQEDWKREQEVVRRLDQDLKFKEEQLIRVQEVNAQQSQMIANMQQELNVQSATIKNLQLRLANQRTVQNNVERTDTSKQDRSIEDLQKLLFQKTEEIDQLQSDFNIVEMTAQKLQEEKMAMENDIEEALQMLEQKNDTIYEQELLIAKLGAQLCEHEEFKAALAEQELKNKIKAETGLNQSQIMDNMSRSSASSFTDQSQFTALKSSRTNQYEGFRAQTYINRGQNTPSQYSGKQGLQMSQMNQMMRSQIASQKIRNTTANANLSGTSDNSQNLDHQPGNVSNSILQQPLTPTGIMDDMHNRVTHNSRFKHDDDDVGQDSYIQGNRTFNNLEASSLENLGGNNMMRLDGPGAQIEYEAHDESRGFSVVQANGMNYDNVSAPDFIPQTDNVTTTNSVFNINSEEIITPRQHQQQDMDPRGESFTFQGKNTKSNKQIIPKIPVVQSAEQPFRGNQQISELQALNEHVSPVTGRKGIPKMDLQIEIEDGEPAVADQLQFQNQRSIQKQKFQSTVEPDVDATSAANQSFADVASHYSTYMRDKQANHLKEEQSVHRFRQKVDIRKAKTKAQLADESIDFSVDGASQSRLQEELQMSANNFSDPQMPKRKMYEHPTSLHINVPDGQNVSDFVISKNRNNPSPRLKMEGALSFPKGTDPVSFLTGVTEKSAQRDNQTMVFPNTTNFENITPEKKREQRASSVLRKSATPKAVKRQIKLADVDQYVGRIKKLQGGQKFGTKPRQADVKVSTQFISDQDVIDFNLQASQELRVGKVNKPSGQNVSKLISENGQKNGQANKIQNHFTLSSPIKDDQPHAHCEMCGNSRHSSQADSDPSPNSGSSAKKPRRQIARKDADHEFFNMSLLSQVMTHKKQKQLIEMQMTDADKLFLLCKSKGLPFFKWNEWIAKHIETSLERAAEFKKNRLNNIVKQGNTKLLERVEEKKLKSSIVISGGQAQKKK